MEGISYKMLSYRCCSKHACRGVTGSPAGLAGAWSPQRGQPGAKGSQTGHLVCKVKVSSILEIIISHASSLQLDSKQVSLHTEKERFSVPEVKRGINPAKTWDSPTCRGWPLRFPCMKRLTRTLTVSQIQNRHLLWPLGSAHVWI